MLDPILGFARGAGPRDPFGAEGYIMLTPSFGDPDGRERIGELADHKDLTLGLERPSALKLAKSISSGWYTFAWYCLVWDPVLKHSFGQGPPLPGASNTSACILDELWCLAEPCELMGRFTTLHAIRRPKLGVRRC